MGQNMPKANRKPKSTDSAAASDQRVAKKASTHRQPANRSAEQVEITPTGIAGLDLVLGGGLPRGRSILVIGGAGSGKTLLGTEFLMRGALEKNEPGVLVTFEESVDELAANAAGFGWDFGKLKKEKMLYPMAIDLSSVTSSTEAGVFDLEALFLRIGVGINAVSAKRIVIDGINNLLASFNNEAVIRSELLRLFKWLKEKGLTIVATGERGDDGWTRLGFEEYLADGLIVLDNRIDGKISKRLLRVVKCRGIAHGTDEYPFLIGREGFSIFPIDAAQLDYKVSSERISSGVAGLDAMLGGKGFYRGSSILIGGSAGTGKSSLGAAFVAAACERGERAVYFTFEESPRQIIRNMKSIGVDLGKWVKKGLLTIHATRALNHGVEGHLTEMQEIVRIADPSVAVIDPISSLTAVGADIEVKSMIARLCDHFRFMGITTVMTNLAAGGNSGEQADLAVSSMADTWILARVIEQNSERNNVIQVLKSRGMSHSKVLKEFKFTKDGIDIIDAYIGVDGVVLGSARHAREAQDELDRATRETEIEKNRQGLAERKRALKAQITALEAEFQAEVDALEAEIQGQNAIEEKRAKAVTAIKSERG